MQPDACPPVSQGLPIENQKAAVRVQKDYENETSAIGAIKREIARLLVINSEY
jgi:hypothetical protein